jgi:hypothetical protein
MSNNLTHVIKSTCKHFFYSSCPFQEIARETTQSIGKSRQIQATIEPDLRKTTTSVSVSSLVSSVEGQSTSFGLHIMLDVRPRLRHRGCLTHVMLVTLWLQSCAPSPWSRKGANLGLGIVPSVKQRGGSSVAKVNGQWNSRERGTCTDTSKQRRQM